MNPFTTMNPTPVTEVPVGNPFDVFGAPNNVNAASQPTATAAEAPLTTTPSLPSQSNPFAVMGTTLPMENLQIGEKPVNEPYLQQPWQAPMNGHHAAAVPSQPQVTTQLQQQEPQLQREQAASPQPPPPQQYTTMPAAPAPFAQAAAAPATDQNPFSWSQPPAPAPTPSVENPWNGSASMPSVQPVPTPFDSFAAAPQAPAPYPQPQAPAPYPQPSSAASGNPFMAPPAAGYSNAMVPSQQTSNPYAGLVVPQQQQQQQYPLTSQAMVPVAPSSSSQWSVGGQQAPVPARAASFDPFAPAPLPAAAPAPPPAPLLPPAPAPVAQDPFFGNAMVPAASASAYPGAPPSNALVPAPNAAYPGAMVPVDAPPPAQSYAKPPPTETQLVTHRSEHSKSDASTSDRGSHNNNDNRQMVAYKPDNNHDEDNVPNDRQLAVVPDDDIEKPKRNLFSEALSKNAPPGSAPLPKADLVVKAGFVLSRISFRTIVMKKWKQSYWVQYGPHTMLWFRSQADFDDWLNNPYHTPSQRNFLIKLAVNFVHDLYKPNVRGYQVTQARTKSYGREQIKQFKLERWMDYGPTIAAAFGSQDPKEVDNLRQALVECMRNTPLEGGVRATGAVRQDHDGRRRGKFFVVRIVRILNLEWMQH